MPTVNFLLDCACTLTPGGADDGTYNAGSPVSFKADKVSWKRTRTVADHSTGQDKVEQNRLKKIGWVVTVETKLYSSSLLAALAGNELASLVVTAPTGFGLTATGVISNDGGDYDSPSTLTFELSCYGTDLAFA